MEACRDEVSASHDLSIMPHGGMSSFILKKAPNPGFIPLREMKSMDFDWQYEIISLTESNKRRKIL